MLLFVYLSNEEENEIKRVRLFGWRSGTNTPMCVCLRGRGAVWGCVRVKMPLQKTGCSGCDKGTAWQNRVKLADTTPIFFAFCCEFRWFLALAASFPPWQGGQKGEEKLEIGHVSLQKTVSGLMKRKKNIFCFVVFLHKTVRHDALWVTSWGCGWEKKIKTGQHARNFGWWTTKKVVFSQHGQQKKNEVNRCDPRVPVQFKWQTITHTFFSCCKWQTLNELQIQVVSVVRLVNPAKFFEIFS